MYIQIDNKVIIIILYVYTNNNLKVIQRIKDSLPIMIKSTFLGAHAVPKNISKKEYLDNILYKMLPDFTKMNLIDFVDVFCEKNYFVIVPCSTGSTWI